MSGIAVGVDFDFPAGPMVVLVSELGKMQCTAIVARSLIAQLRVAVAAIDDWDDDDSAALEKE